MLGETSGMRLNIFIWRAIVHAVHKDIFTAFNVFEYLRRQQRTVCSCEGYEVAFVISGVGILLHCFSTITTRARLYSEPERGFGMKMLA